jgi:hypothetical protein
VSLGDQERLPFALNEAIAETVFGRPLGWHNRQHEIGAK